MEKKYNFEDFLKIMDTLRSENGCPWDKVQTHESLRECMLEEAYEVVEAINKKDSDNLCEELGDVLMQIVFHAKIEQEQGNFDITDVINGISEKMIRRHSHIFSHDVANTPQQVTDNWEKIKKQEKNYQTQSQALNAIPNALPALIRAQKVQKKASQSAMDFSCLQEAFCKLEEETKELQEAIQEQSGNVEEELGDILFSIVNISRFLKINAEFALTNAIKKFINRFEYVENSALSKGKTLCELSPENLDILWEQAKKQGY